MRALAAAVAAGLALVAAGCGGDGPSRRDLVSDYIEQVNQIQAGLRAPALAVTEASRDLGDTEAERAAVEAKLREAAQTIDLLRGRLELLDTPEDAEQLHALLLDLMQREASLAREVAALVVFVPAFEEALRPLGAASRQLNDAMAAQTTPEEKAEALDSYEARVERVLDELRGLSPPPVSAPAHASQVAALERVAVATSALADALRANDATEIPALLRRLERAATSTQTLAAQKARIAAIRAYNARVRGLDGLVTRIQQERIRLQGKLD